MTLISFNLSEGPLVLGPSLSDPKVLELAYCVELLFKDASYLFYECLSQSDLNFFVLIDRLLFCLDESFDRSRIECFLHLSQEIDFGGCNLALLAFLCAQPSELKADC